MCGRASKALPPLIVRIDVPDDSLGEDLVLVERDEAAQSEWADLLHHDGVGGAVAFKDLVWGGIEWVLTRARIKDKSTIYLVGLDLLDGLFGHSRLLKLGLHDLHGLALHQGLGLG